LRSLAKSRRSKSGDIGKISKRFTGAVLLRYPDEIYTEAKTLIPSPISVFLQKSRYHLDILVLGLLLVVPQ
jgi:hypothetical protein